MLDSKTGRGETVEKVRAMGARMGKLERVRHDDTELKKAEEAQKHFAKLEGG